jgi:hypothetical protein
MDEKEPTVAEDLIAGLTEFADSLDRPINVEWSEDEFAAARAVQNVRCDIPDAEPFTVSVDADTFDRVGAMLAANRIANLLRKPDARTPSEARAQEKAVAKRRAKAKAARKARARNRK